MSFKSNLQSSLQEQRTRVFLFLMIAIILIVSLFAYSTMRKTGAGNAGNEIPERRTAVTNPTYGIDSTPGISQPSEEYQELEKKYEEKQVKEATKKAEEGTPGAALPTLRVADIPVIEGIEPPKEDPLQKRLEEQRTLREQRERERLVAQEQRRLDEIRKEELRIYAKQTNVLADVWKVIPQKYVEGKVDGYPESDMVRVLREARKEKPKLEKPKIFYKAGDILFGVVLTSVNSDEPGPVLARIISGPLSNAKIIGGINPKTIPESATKARVSKSLVLEFSLLNVPGAKSSIPVKAIAIDPQTARTSLATSVDNHYLIRYGTFFAAEFLSGLGQAISAQSNTLVATGNGIDQVGRTGRFSNSDEAKIAVGKTAEALGKNINFLDRPPTIKVAAGTPVGLLLQEDIMIGGEDTDTRKLIIQPTASTSSSNPTIDSMVSSEGNQGSQGSFTSNVYGKR